MISRKDIIDAYSHIRKIDSSIPDPVLDFMFHSALNALPENDLPEQEDSDADSGFEELKSVFMGSLSVRDANDEVAALLEQARLSHRKSREILDRKSEK